MSNTAAALDSLEACGYVKARERRDNCAGCVHSRTTGYGGNRSRPQKDLRCDLHHASVAAGSVCDDHKPDRQSALIAPRLADQSAGLQG